MNSRIIKNISKNEIVNFLTNNNNFDFEESFINAFEIDNPTDKQIEDYKKRTINDLAGKLKDSRANTVTYIEYDIIENFYNYNEGDIDDNNNPKMITLFYYFKVIIEQMNRGGKKSRKSRKVIKSKKSRKVRKSKKSRKVRKSRK